jgi:hypothetical protein
MGFQFNAIIVVDKLLLAAFPGISPITPAVGAGGQNSSMKWR